MAIRKEAPEALPAPKKTKTKTKPEIRPIPRDRIEDISVRLNVPLEVLLSAYLHREPEPTVLHSRWGARRASRNAEREPGQHAEPAPSGPRKNRK